MAVDIPPQFADHFEFSYEDEYGDEIHEMAIDVPASMVPRDFDHVTPPRESCGGSPELGSRSDIYDASNNTLQSHGQDNSGRRKANGCLKTRTDDFSRPQQQQRGYTNGYLSSSSEFESGPRHSTPIGGRTHSVYADVHRAPEGYRDSPSGYDSSGYDSSDRTIEYHPKSHNDGTNGNRITMYGYHSVDRVQKNTQCLDRADCRNTNSIHENNTCSLPGRSQQHTMNKFQNGDDGKVNQLHNGEADYIKGHCDDDFDDSSHNEPREGSPSRIAADEKKAKRKTVKIVCDVEKDKDSFRMKKHMFETNGLVEKLSQQLLNPQIRSHGKATTCSEMSDNGVMKNDTNSRTSCQSISNRDQTHTNQSIEKVIKSKQICSDNGLVASHSKVDYVNESGSRYEGQRSSDLAIGVWCQDSQQKPRKLNGILKKTAHTSCNGSVSQYSGNGGSANNSDSHTGSNSDISSGISHHRNGILKNKGDVKRNGILKNSLNVNSYNGDVNLGHEHIYENCYIEENGSLDRRKLSNSQYNQNCDDDQIVKGILQNSLESSLNASSYNVYENESFSDLHNQTDSSKLAASVMGQKFTSVDQQKFPSFDGSADGQKFSSVDRKFPSIDRTVPRHVRFVDEGDGAADDEVVHGGAEEDELEVVMRPLVDMLRREEGDGMEEPDSDDSGDSQFDPPWVDHVSSQGDVFFIEPDTGQSPLRDSPMRDALMTNAADILQHGDSAEITPGGKNQKGLRKKVAEFMSPASTNINNNSKRHSVRVLSLNATNLSAATNGHVGVTFNDVPTGVIKEATLYVDPKRHNYGRRASLCESLFGIIPGFFGSRSQVLSSPLSDKRIMVQGLLPGGEAMRCGGVKIGEWLMAVNDTHVNFDNIDDLLATITEPQTVKLSLQKVAILTSPKAKLVKKQHLLREDLVKLVSGQQVSETGAPSLAAVTHAVMYLTMEAAGETEANNKEDIVYSFCASAASRQLVDVRGLFITLSHMLHDVTHNPPHSSTLVHGGRLVHVGYCKENRQVFVMCLPADKVTVQETRHIVSDVVRVLKVLYGSLHSAFSRRENHGRLDHYFTLLLQRTLLQTEFLRHGAKQTHYVEPLFSVLPGVRGLTLPDEVKVTMNNCLSELEAAEFAEMSEEYYGMRRLYTIVGSCLFHKGYLVASHLHREDLADAHLFLQHHCLLTLCADDQLGQVVVWREVFPTRRCHQQVDPLIPGFTEPEARWFMLVVGLKNLLIAVLLEAGGCSLWAEGVPHAGGGDSLPRGIPPPDPFYVDQVRAVLLQLESQDVLHHCQVRLESPPVPSLACIDWFVPRPSSKTKSDQDSSILKLANSPKPNYQTPSKKQPESILKNKGLQQTQLKHGRGLVYDTADSDADSLSTATSEGSSPATHLLAGRGSDDSGDSGGMGSAGLFRSNKRRRNLLSAYDLTGLKKSSLGDEEPGCLVKLPSGCDNTLFHYVQLDSLDGVFLCPAQQDLAQTAGASTLHNALLANFHAACLSIRKLFAHSHKCKTWSESGTTGKFGPDSSLGDVQEHGVLFSCAPAKWTEKKTPPNLHYWVVGRMFPKPYPREFYVCFHDSAQQNVVEMAFKLGFGMML